MHGTKDIKIYPQMKKIQTSSANKDNNDNGNNKFLAKF